MTTTKAPAVRAGALNKESPRMIDPDTGHTAGYPRPFTNHPYAVRMREDLARSGRTVTVERLDKLRPPAYADHRGELAIIERRDGLMIKVVVAESQLSADRPINVAAQAYADAFSDRYVPFTETPASETPAPESEPDTRFTVGLIYDVVKVLKTYGYVMDDDTPAMARTMLALGDLVKVFEGRDNERQAADERNAQRFERENCPRCGQLQIRDVIVDGSWVHHATGLIPCEGVIAARAAVDEAAEAAFRAADEQVDRELAEMEEHPGPEVAKAEAAYRGETPPKYAMLAPDAPQVYAEMLKAVEQVDAAAEQAEHAAAEYLAGLPDDCGCGWSAGCEG